MNLKGSKTEKNLKDAFAGESQANRRYLYFAAKADVEGYNDVSDRVPFHRRRRDGPRARTPRIPRNGGRSGDGSADRRDQDESEGRHRRRNARVQRHVPGHGEGRRAKKGSPRSPTGSRRSRRPNARTRIASRKPSTPSDGHAAWARETPAYARAACRLPRVTRSTGGALNSSTRPRSRKNSSASSTSATAVAAASACAIHSPHCLMRSTRARRSSSMASTRRCTGTSSITVTCVTCAS